MDKSCAKCGGQMEAGAATASGLLGGAVASPDKPRLLFVIPGTLVSMNPIKAFKQGLTEEPDRRGFWIEGLRCKNCGSLELYARDRATV